MDIRIKRVYEPYDPADGFRVLVDRVWPRGLTKEKVHYDLWEKELAPSTPVRRAFGHKPENWDAFQKAYRSELDANPAALDFAHKLGSPEFAKQLASEGFGNPPRVTLIYGAKNETMNQAVVLAHWFPKHMG